MTTQQQLLCNGNFLTITAHLATLQNQRHDGLSTLRVVHQVTAYRTAALKTALVNAALPQDVSP